MEGALAKERSRIMQDVSVCHILTDPLSIFSSKGEIKRNYYNPGRFFSKIYFLEFSDSKADVGDLKIITGDVEYEVYSLGTVNVFNFLGIIIKAYCVIKQLHPSVIRAYDPSSRGFLAVVLSRILGIPAVVSIHAHMDEQRQHDYRVLLRIRRLFEALTLRLADKVICVTAHVKGYVLKHGAKQSNTEVVYNGVTLDQFIFSRSQERSKKRTILCVARLDRPKYQECLIRAMVGFDADLVLIGDGEELGKYLRLVDHLNLNERVKFIKSVPHNQIHNYYASADVFAIATHYEGFCIPLIEAMASGVPVVASNIPAIKEVLGDAGLLADNNPDDFKKKIELLFNNPSLYKEFSEKGTERAKMFDMKINELKQIEIYRKILKRT